MAVAAGGKIKQGIMPDKLEDRWQSNRTTVFNVQILNSAVYEAVTGQAPPTKPINAQTYEMHGLPFYKLCEEPSGIFGDFSLVKSIAQINGEMEQIVTPDTVEISSMTAQRPVGLTNPNGPLRELRTLRDLMREFERLHISSF